MPELPDVELYLHALRSHFQGKHLEKLVVRSPFLVRTFDIDVGELDGKQVVDFSRIGKRIIWHFNNELFLVIHLMIAGRFHKRKAGRLPGGKTELAAFLYDDCSLLLTEAGSRKRASLHIVRGANSLNEFERGGLDVLNCTPQEFEERVASQNRTLKRLLTDPTILDGIGNAYSDEILLEARLSPFKKSQSLSRDEIQRLLVVTHDVLTRYTEMLVKQTGDNFPEKVTAFRPEMKAHGKYNQPCAVCQTAIQRVRYAENEMNYCPRCQTDGKILADRSLSRLLKDDWPNTIDELER